MRFSRGGVSIATILIIALLSLVRFIRQYSSVENLRENVIENDDKVDWIKLRGVDKAISAHIIAKEHGSDNDGVVSVDSPLGQSSSREKLVIAYCHYRQEDRRFVSFPENDSNVIV